MACGVFGGLKGEAAKMGGGGGEVAAVVFLLKSAAFVSCLSGLWLGSSCLITFLS